MLSQERDERTREKLSYQLSIYSLFWSQGAEECESELIQDVEPIDEETEMMYLTLSWWICNIGWKDVGERVRRGVEEVFDECVFPFSSYQKADISTTFLQHFIED